MARDFDGVDDQVANALEDVGAFTSGTICWWQRPDVAFNSGTVKTIWGQNVQPAPPEWSAQKFSDNKWYVGWNTDTGGDDRVVVAASSSNWRVDLWDFYAYTWIVDSDSFFYQGAASAMTQLGTVAVTNVQALTSNFFVGQRGGGSEFFDGKMADVRIFKNSVLNEGQLLLVMRGGVVGIPRLWWPLWGVNSPEPDWSGNNSHGTLTGTLVFDHPPGISAVWLAPHPRLSQVAAAAAAGADGGGPRPFAAVVPGFP